MFFARAGVQNSYNYKVKIGNWSEEQELEELKMKEFLYRKASGGLLIERVQGQLAKSLCEVPLSYSSDGDVHFGDAMMLYSVATEGVLSTDPQDRAQSNHDAFAVTTSNLTHAHVARNTFIIEPYATSAKHGEVLKYGQFFRIRIHPKLSARPMYLHSQPVSTLCSSKVSRFQEVCFAPSSASSGSSSNSLSYDTVWKCVARDINVRFELENTPVPANAELVIVHAATSSALSSSLLSYHNDFGLEYEVCAHTHMNIGKTQGLYAELTGKITTDIPVRRELKPNLFAILTAATPQAANGDASSSSSSSSSSSTTTTAAAAAMQLLSKVRDHIMIVGGRDALHNLSRTFRIMDPKGVESVSLSDFDRALRVNQVSLSGDEVRQLASLFDSHGIGEIEYTNLLNQMRGGPPNERRLKLILRVFDALQVDGWMNVKDAVLVYEPNGDPLVRNGKITREQSVKMLLAAFEGYNAGSGLITKNDFVDYYATYSAFTESDDYFCNVLTCCWRIKEN